MNKPIISVATTPFMFPKRKKLKKLKENQKKLQKRQTNPKGNWNLPVKKEKIFTSEKPKRGCLDF